MQRPLGVTMLAILAIIAGVLFILSAVVPFSVLFVDRPDMAPLAAFATLLLGVLGVAYLVFGFGAWTLKGWAWTLGVLNQVGALVMAAGHFFTDGRIGWFHLLIAAVLLFYLYRPGVKQAFGRA